MSTVSHATPCVDPVAVEAALRIILAPGQITELRALDAITADDRRPHVVSGYFDDAEKLAAAAGKIKTAKGLYFVPNPVKPALLARAMNRARAVGREPTTSDHDIARRAWLLVDCDAVRPAGVSASDAEHDAAIAKAGLIRAALAEQGWPEPILADSGNGAHLLYRVDLPTDDGGLVERCLLALADRFDDAQVTVDRKVFNPARIWKLYGTRAGKGDPEAAAIGRPQRLASITDAPGELRMVSPELLEALAAQAPKAATTTSTGNGRPVGQSFDVLRFMAQHGMEHRGEKPYRGGVLYELEACPFNSDHRGGSACVTVAADGKLGFLCQHSGCYGRQWRHVRDLFEPGRQQGNGRAERFNHIAADVDAGAYGDAWEPPVDDARGSVGESAKTSRADDHKIVYQRLTCAELDAAEYTTEYLVERTLVACQPCVFAGGKKTLKTSLLVDLAIALATAGYFLGYLQCSRRARVALMSGESGLATLQETARRIAAAAHWELRDIDNLIFSPDLPVFGHVLHVDAFKLFLIENKIEVVILDPAYLCIPTEGNEGSLFAIGKLLRAMSDVCQECGAMMVLAHHTKKGVVDPFQPVELEDISWAGFQEFARQWLLVSRRKKYEPGTGEHKLWLNVGGSAGHSALWGVDIAEGVYDGHTPRYWDVTVRKAEDVREEAGDAQEQAKQAKRDEQLEREKKLILAALAKFPVGESKTTIRERTALGGKRFNTPWADLLDAGEIVPCGRIKKENGHTYDAYKLA